MTHDQGAVYEGEVVSPALASPQAQGTWRGRFRSSEDARVWLGRVLFLAAILGAWEFASGRLINEFWLSRPSTIGGVLWDLLTDAPPGETFLASTLIFHFVITVQEAILGFIAGSVTAVIAGIALAQFEIAARIVNPFIIAVYSLPKIALAPLFILWFGIGLESKIIFAGVVVFFLVFWSTYLGAREVDRELVDVVRLMGAKRRTIVTKVVFPSALVFIFSGLKAAAPYAVVGAVVSELIASNRGIGYLIAKYSSQFDTAGVFAVLVVLMVLSTVIRESLQAVESRVLKWKVSGQ